MTPNQLFADFVSGFPNRKFTAGLLIAFIDLFVDLEVPGGNYKTFEGVIKRFPRQMTTAQGKRANTLIVERSPGNTVSLRPFYNAAERYFRADHKRFDYPSCAPHATQAWQDYIGWLDALTTFTPKQLAALRKDVVDFVLANLKSQAFDPSTITTEPPLFEMVLDTFDMTARKGEATGAAFQGIVFGFLRADNPHLQIEIDKVRTGSKRLQRIGDIDGWEGARLALSAEVKQLVFKADAVADVHDFANAVGQRGAIGLLVALSFEPDVRITLEGLGLKPLDTDDLLRIVELWDPLKQRTAVASFVYYARHVEKSSSLADRLDDFLKKAAESHASGRLSAPAQ